MFPGAGEKQTQEQQRNSTVEESFNTYLFNFWSCQRYSLSVAHTQSDNHILVNDYAASSRCRPTLKLLKGELLSVTRSLLALKRWQRKAIYLWPWVHARVPSRSYCWRSDLSLPRGGAELLIQADFVQLWDIPSVKCHLFYIYSTDMTHKFSFSPPCQGLYCPHREIWKSKWNVLFF